MPDPIRDFIAASRARCEAATKGPWTHIEDAPMFVGSTEMVQTPNSNINVGRVYSQNLQPRHDAAFIAHARTDLPRALEALERAMAFINHEDSLWGDPSNPAATARADIARILAGEGE